MAQQSGDSRAQAPTEGFDLDLESRLVGLEARIVEQDHRPIHVVNTFLTRKRWGDDDPRRIAALRALIWRILFSPAVLAATGGTVAILSLGVLVWQNVLIREQNDYFQEQIAQQQRQVAAQQSVDNQTLRTRAIEQIYGPVFELNPRVKAEAVRTLIAIERARVLEDPASNTLVSDYLNLHEADLTETWLERADLRRTSFRRSVLSAANLNRANLSEASLRFVIGAGLSALDAELNKAQIAFSDLNGAQMNGATFENALVSNSRLREADLSKSDWAGSSWINADLRFSVLSDIDHWQKVESMAGTNLFGVVDPPPGFLEHAISLGAVVDENAEDDFEARRGAQLRIEEGRRVIGN